MAQWSRVWGSTSNGCSAGCYNPLYPPRSPNGNVLDGFPLSIQTPGQALDEFAAALKASIPANNVLVRYVSTSTYALDVRIDSKTTATVTIQFTGSTCDFPVRSTYTKGSSTGNASFSGLTELLNWLVVSLH